ncbi:PREDICTED: zinc finger protein CG2199-like isoform X1 [Papilio xuthus]|uniref:Zinc finger protein CG2199-like isoform X1 n=2 Tax=Papilio xuthus TaxID=66420 RepID=A0AAJ6ZK96_PAPXU|nr:PREDICTED: zinc finger protein CG2199-like isoform X1 [Papilio xuthus]
MEEEEDFVGCISCMNNKDLCDLFAIYADNEETYAQMLKSCYNIKISTEYKFICSDCVEKLEKASAFKNQTSKNLAMLQSIKDEEYLDESILEEGEGLTVDYRGNKTSHLTSTEDVDDINEEHEIQALDETTCIYCNVQLPTAEEIDQHVRMVHGLEPRTGQRVRECSLCGASLNDLADHINRCHSATSESESRQYACHFCDNVYNSKKACFTHLRMKHGLKLCNDHTPKYSPTDRKKCHICQRDFSQKQILNNHLWKAHGYEVEKRKAFFCPLCNERVSYGTNFSAHLLHRHQVREQVEQLEFGTMDDFMLFKSAIQEETKFRFRKTTASKQTIEGVRSHYMCSQSGIYVYQGKGKRPAPERQIYKTGKACPAHMIVTETMDRVLVTFYKTHVGHGTCPYYEPREPKRSKCEETEGCPQLVCDACGAGFSATDKFKTHVASHGLKLFPCEHCDDLFQNIDAWTRHVRIEHDSNLL